VKVLRWRQRIRNAKSLADVWEKVTKTGETLGNFVKGGFQKSVELGARVPFSQQSHEEGRVCGKKVCKEDGQCFEKIVAVDWQHHGALQGVSARDAENGLSACVFGVMGGTQKGEGGREGGGEKWSEERTESWGESLH